MRWLGGVQSEGAIAREAGYFIKAEKRDELTFWALELARPKTFLGFDQLRIPAFVSRAATESSVGRKLMVKLGMKRRRDLDCLPLGEDRKLTAYVIDAYRWRKSRNCWCGPRS